ncbi:MULTISPECIES: phage holin family protein [Flavobacterium]|uniref:phage holin family protein n=1 Tax=Flavobacterium TaxID=237 RepID=UPI001FCC5788|nr:MULTISPECIES: phage holin family protein [Flavobacterium]UOK42790.1 phage holin family protein [Flavobacterium enshiense]
MKNLLVRLLITTILIIVLSYFLPGIDVTFKAALITAVVLGLLNTFLKPVLVFFTLPITLMTLGLFLLVINTFMVLLADYLIDDFTVKSNIFVNAFIFSVVLSLSQWFLNLFVKD